MNNGEFATTDYMIGSLLRAEGFQLLRMEMHNGRVRMFFDDPKRKAERIANAHNTKGVSINSQKFADALQWTKTRIFTFKRGQEK